jgi:hypothetical protein
MFFKGDIVIAAASWELTVVCEVSRDNGAIRKMGSRWSILSSQLQRFFRLLGTHVMIFGLEKFIPMLY